MNKQELRKLIRESFGNDSQIYVTEGIEVDAYLSSTINPDDYYTNKSKATIYWIIDMENKSFGIKEFFPVIKKIDLNLEIWREENQEYETIKKVFDNISAADGGTIEDFKLTITKTCDRGHIYPTDLLMDEGNKTIEISFDMP
jgi:hypothetical protein